MKRRCKVRRCGETKTLVMAVPELDPGIDPAIHAAPSR
jgi:hypothetical protein